MGSFVGSFYGTGYDVGGTCVGLVVGGIMTASEIYTIKFNDSYLVSYKSDMYSLLISWHYLGIWGF